MCHPNEATAPHSIPAVIRQHLGNEACVQDETGMSRSQVLLFEDLVLKIQPASAETDNEQAFLRWARGKLPVPKLEAYLVEDGMAYTLTERLRGTMLCDKEYMLQPQRLTELVAEGLSHLWSVSREGCPDQVSPLERRLATAAEKLEAGQIDLENVEPETYGPGGFSSPEALLSWLEDNRPEEDVVVTHGDYCLPNLFGHRGQLLGFIDLGKAGPADRWQDIAIAQRSLHHNFTGSYGPSYPGYQPNLLLDILGIPQDPEKERYYRLLDELF